MMPPPPIEAMLGVKNSANPFDVLGLPIGPITESDVIDALGGRMQQVAAHPQSETPEGNEVRLALHAAAAQLLDDRVRSALLERAGVTAGAARAHTPRRRSAAALGPQAMMVIASEGGWNPRAMRRLALLAHAEGIASSAVPEVVRSLAGQGGGRAAAETAGPRQGRVPRREAPLQTSDGLQTILTGGAVLIAIVVLAITWMLLSPGGQAPVTDTEQAAAAAQTRAESGPSEELVGPELARTEQGVAPTADPVPAMVDAPDWASALIGMRDAKEAVDAETISRVTQGVSETWTAQAPQNVQRIVTAFVDAVYLMPPEEGRRLVGTLARRIRGDGPRSSSLHAGLLARLSVERSLPTPVDNAIVSAMVSTIGSGQRAHGAEFVGGAALGLGMTADGWAETPPSAEVLAEWLQAADAIAAIDARREAVLVRETLEAIVRSDADPLADAALLRTIREIASRLDPTADPDASGMVLRVLADQGINTRSVSVLVNSLARASSQVSGADAVRLSPNASQTERAEIRTRLAELWLDATDPAASLGDLIDPIESHLAANAPEQTAQGWLADAVASARLSNACRLSLWGADEQAVRIAESYRDDIDRITSGSGRRGQGGNASNDAWVDRYLEAKRNIPVRLSLLGERVRQRGRLGTIAAELVVAEAISGSPVRVRREAQNVVALNADQPEVINAALELLPTAPRVRSVHELIERISLRPLPDIDDPSWPFAARQAVVDRLLEVESGVGASMQIDQLAVLLSEEHAGIASVSITSGDAPESAVEALVEERLAEIRRLDIGSTVAADTAARARLLAGRLTLSEGSAARYAAYQVTATELLATIVELESPFLRDRARAVIAEVSAQRLAASSVFEQMAATERAALELWAMRIGGAL